MKIFFVFGAKLANLFDIRKFFYKISHFYAKFFYFYTFSTIFPFKVAAEASSIWTNTYSPIWRP